MKKHIETKDTCKKQYYGLRKYGIITVLLLCTMVAHSQTKYSIDDSVKRHKWEIYLNVAPILKLPVADFTYLYMVKRNVGKENSLGAWRFMINPKYRQIEEKDPDLIINGFTNSTLFETNLLIGYERQKYIKRFCYYYGLDFDFRYDHRQAIAKNGRWMSPDGEKRGQTKSVDINIYYFVSPFLGVKYLLNDRLGVSLESKSYVGYYLIIAKRTFEETEFFSRRVTSQDLGYYLLYSLNLSYHF